MKKKHSLLGHRGTRLKKLCLFCQPLPFRGGSCHSGLGLESAAFSKGVSSTTFGVRWLATGFQQGVAADATPAFFSQSLVGVCPLLAFATFGVRGGTAELSRWADTYEDRIIY